MFCLLLYRWAFGIVVFIGWVLIYVCGMNNQRRIFCEKKVILEEVVGQCLNDVIKDLVYLILSIKDNGLELKCFDWI